MRKYSKAYQLKDLRAYSKWEEKERDDKDELTDDLIVYLQDNFTVVRDVFEEEDFIFDTVDDEWKAFCKDQLGFEIPEDLRYAYEEEGEGSN
ncbi:MAG: hypothetical protein AAGD01_04330 [Acidobacteriota bacterium]